MTPYRARLRAHLLLAVFALVLCACTATSTPRPSGDDELYADLGGRAGIEALVEAFLWRLADDARINMHFADSNIARFREKLVEHFCVVSGGPEIYTGDTMKQTHAGMGLDDADFNALVEDLIEAMESLNVPTGVQNRLLARLAPLHADIVEAG